MTQVRKALSSGFNGGDGGGNDKIEILFRHAVTRGLPHNSIIMECERKAIPYTAEDQKNGHLLMLGHQEKWTLWPLRAFNEIEPLLNENSDEYNAIFAAAFNEFTQGKSFDVWKQGINVSSGEVSYPPFGKNK